MGYVKKTELTKSKLREAFIALIISKDFNQVTVNEIAERAEVTRGSFYRYYEDKYEMLSELEDEIIALLQNSTRRKKSVRSESEVVKVEEIIKMLQSLSPYILTISALLRDSHIKSFEMKLKREILKKIEYVDELKKISEIRRNLIKEYICALMIKTLDYWVNHPDEETLREIANTIADVQLQGIKYALGINVKSHFK